MSILKDISVVLGRAKVQSKLTKAKEYICTDCFGKNSEKDSENKAFLGNNINLLKTLATDTKYKNSFQMIYIDPPFFSDSNYDATINLGDNNIKYRAYGDKWKQGHYEYLKQLASRLILMKEILKDSGLIFVHLDWHVVHYVKIIMDEIFGEKNFVNEIIWQYKSGGSTKKRFSRKHDTILVYSKTNKYKFYPLEEKSYNRGLKPYRFKGVDEYKDEIGWYTMVNMKDVWQIDMVGRTSAERIGYATQKPESLLENIIRCSTKEGDLCGDFFCGSGTLPYVSAKLGRNFIVCDENTLAIESTMSRLGKDKLNVSKYIEASAKNRRTNNYFKADVLVETEGTSDCNKLVLKIKLCNVKENYLSLRFDEKTREVISDKLKNGDLSLINSWSIDYNYNGLIHRASDVFFRNKGNITSSWSKILDISESRRISIKIVDIMGNVYYTEKVL